MISNELKNYLDSFQYMDETDTRTKERIEEFLHLVTSSEDVFCSAISYVDKWERVSKGFEIATMFHLSCLKESVKGIPLCKKYQTFYKRCLDENDYMYKRISELEDIKNEKII